MDDRINDILLKLQNGKLDVDNTVKEIKSLKRSDVEEKHQRKASKLKIFIDATDDKSDKKVKLNLPGIPFWLIKSLSGPFIKFAMKHSGDKVNGIKPEYLKYLKHILNALSQMPPFEIVNVDAKDAKVHIYTK